MQERIHDIVPGGAHTLAKGDDQFPVLAPGFIARGHGSHVFDVDGNEYIEYGMGCRAVTLGHAYPRWWTRASRTRPRLKFRPSGPALELECAETLPAMIPGADMCKFAKDGSSATTAAIKLARAHTGPHKVALCGDHPFFSVHDWFIGTTAIDAGIPQAVPEPSADIRLQRSGQLARSVRRSSRRDRRRHSGADQVTTKRSTGSCTRARTLRRSAGASSCWTK